METFQGIALGERPALGFIGEPGADEDETRIRCSLEQAQRHAHVEMRDLRERRARLAQSAGGGVDHQLGARLRQADFGLGQIRAPRQKQLNIRLALQPPDQVAAQRAGRAGENT